MDVHQLQLPLARLGGLRGLDLPQLGRRLGHHWRPLLQHYLLQRPPHSLRSQCRFQWHAELHLALPQRLQEDPGPGAFAWSGALLTACARNADCKMTWELQSVLAQHISVTPRSGAFAWSEAALLTACARNADRNGMRSCILHCFSARLVRNAVFC